MQTDLIDRENALLEESSLTRGEFCTLERISLATFHKLRKLGLGPEELRLAGSVNFLRITAQARRDWHKKMREHSQAEEVLLQQVRRSAQTSAAGKRGAASALHHCRRKEKA